MKINLLASRLNGVLVLAFATLLFSCSQLEPFSLENDNVLKSTFSSSDGPYNVDLTVRALDGGLYEWVWKVTNPNPKNGSEGSIQNLSHWNITLGKCAQINDITYAGFSNDGGVNYEGLLPLKLEADQSIRECSNASVLKFDRGTEGSIPSYYKLIVDKDFSVDEMLKAYYKSGTNTGCGEFTFPGFGCIVEKNCYKEETAWSVGTRYVNKGNWGTYTITDTYPKTVEIKAGQFHTIGHATFEKVGDEVKISINLDKGRFNPTKPDNLKIEGYSNINDTRLKATPVPGSFSIKRTVVETGSWSETFPLRAAYAIHIDAERVADCPESL